MVQIKIGLVSEISNNGREELYLFQIFSILERVSTKQAADLLENIALKEEDHKDVMGYFKLQYENQKIIPYYHWE